MTVRWTQPTCYVRYLNEHGRGEVDALHELKVDVHVEGNLSPTFQLLLLCTAIMAGDEALWGEGRKGEGMEREIGRGGVERGGKKERAEGGREMGDKTEKKEEVGRERRADNNATRKLQLSTVHTHAHLCKKLLGAATRLNIHKSIVSILDHAMSKGTHAQLHQCPVVQNLGTLE